MSCLNCATFEKRIFIVNYPIALRNAKIVYNIGLSECSRVNHLKIAAFFDYRNCNKCHPGPGCSKLTRSLVNILLRFQMLLSKIHQCFLFKDIEKLLHCKSFSSF